MTNKILTLLGFAAKAGKLSYGMEAAAGAIAGKKSRLAVVSSSISEKSRKEVRFHAGRGNIPVLVLADCDTQTVADAVGRKCGIISVNDSSFAGAMLKAADQGGNANDDK